ncbi:recombination protein NinG [Oceanisphaera sp. KMM 10153]|uniref:recombination protein NinG n=1 Tax=Oceanisphaera submarina TaxID=3390193 RepID=UPI003976B77C
MANSKRRCKHCREYHPAPAGIKTPGGWFCSVAHAADFAQGKVRTERARDHARMHRQRKMDVKPIGYWMKRAQAAFNAYIRERDAVEPCISCGRHHDGQYHAGHFRTTGAAPELRFEEANCHKQCAPCNNHLSGNLVAYRVSLIDKIGLAWVEWLEGPQEPKRYRKEDYQAIEAEYKNKLKLLQQHQGGQQ